MIKIWLDKAKLDEFLRWVMTLGYTVVFTGYDYETARLVREEGDPPVIIYHRKRSPDLTVTGKGTELLQQFWHESDAYA